MGIERASEVWGRIIYLSNIYYQLHTSVFSGKQESPCVFVYSYKCGGTRMDGTRKGRRQRGKGLMAGVCACDTMLMCGRLFPNSEGTILLSHTSACIAIGSRLWSAAPAESIAWRFLGAIWEQVKDGSKLISKTGATT